MYCADWRVLNYSLYTPMWCLQIRKLIVVCELVHKFPKILCTTTRWCRIHKMAMLDEKVLKKKLNFPENRIHTAVYSRRILHMEGVTHSRLALKLSVSGHSSYVFLYSPKIHRNLSFYVSGLALLRQIVGGLAPSGVTEFCNTFYSKKLPLWHFI